MGKHPSWVSKPDSREVHESMPGAGADVPEAKGNYVIKAGLPPYLLEWQVGEEYEEYEPFLSVANFSISLALEHFGPMAQLWLICQSLFPAWDASRFSYFSLCESLKKTAKTATPHIKCGIGPQELIQPLLFWPSGGANQIFGAAPDLTIIVFAFVSVMDVSWMCFL